jgi:hypothetical protein
MVNSDVMDTVTVKITIPAIQRLEPVSELTVVMMVGYQLISAASFQICTVICEVRLVLQFHSPCDIKL